MDGCWLETVGTGPGQALASGLSPIRASLTAHPGVGCGAEWNWSGSGNTGTLLSLERTDGFFWVLLTLLTPPRTPSEQLCSTS